MDTQVPPMELPIPLSPEGHSTQHITIHIVEVGQVLCQLTNLFLRTLGIIYTTLHGL